MNYLRLSFYSLMLALVACGGGGSDGGGYGGSSSGGGSGGGTGLDLDDMEPTLASIQTHLFTPTCAVSGCHNGSGAPEGLQLTEGDSAALLIGVPSSQVPSVNRVTSGDPDNSYLIWKLEGRAGIQESRMPRNGPFLTDAQIAIIAQWISDGVPKTASESLSQTLKVTTLSPASGSELLKPPSHIVIGFNQELDAATLQQSSIVLTQSGGDGEFNQGNEQTIRLSSLRLNPANPNTVIADLVKQTLEKDVYRITVKSGGDTPVQDLMSRRLDQDFTGHFRISH